MEDICIICLCTGRNLMNISGTDLHQVYLQILNEPVMKMVESYLRVCWECRAALNNFQHFKQRAQLHYSELLHHIQRDVTALLAKQSRLQICSLESVDIPGGRLEETRREPETFVEERKTEKRKRGRVKLQKPPKVKIKKEKVKKEVSPPVSGGSDADEDPFVDPGPEDAEERDEKSLTGPPEVDAPAKVEVQEVKANGHTRTRSREQLPERPQCVECGKMFSSRKTYRYHLNVLHKGQNRYPCPRCGKVYQWKSNLGRHMRSHKALDSGELYCDICDKKFASVATFRQHLRSSRKHVSETDFSFMCNECGKKFVNKTRLRDHIDWEHLNKIKFKCQLCDKAFKCHTSLYVHLQNVHRDKERRDNLCHVCGKSYQNAAKLRYHIVAMHTTETPYSCERCGAAFGWYSSLYRHVREVHHKMKVQPKKCKKPKKVSDGPQLPAGE